MAVISIDQAAVDAYHAGWRGADWVYIVALSMQEALHRALPGGGWGLDTNSVNQGHYGILQFAPSTIQGLGYQPQDAFDPVKSYAAALTYYNQHGKNFPALTASSGPWYASAASFVQWLSAAGDAVVHAAAQLGTGSPGGTGPLSPSDPSSTLNPGNIAGGIGHAITTGWVSDLMAGLGNLGHSVLPHVVLLGGIGVVAVFLLLELRGEVVRTATGAATP